MTNPATLVLLTPVSPPQVGVTTVLLGDSTYEQATSGSGGWQIVDRPKQTAATQWYDRSPWELDLPLMFDSAAIYGVNGLSIENQCLLLESWMDNVPGTLIPPILKIGGPLPGTQREWCVYSLQFGNALRDPNSGFRTQQMFDITLYEYIPPLVSGNTGTPVQNAQAATAALSAYYQYIVKAGDTLGTIAARLYNNYNDWPFIANANGIRDPNNLTVGETINLPVNNQLNLSGI
jgi:LysM repeat protein